MRRFSEDPYSNDEFEDLPINEFDDDDWNKLNNLKLYSSSSSDYEFDADQVEEFPKGNEEEWVILNYSNFKELIDSLNNEKTEKYKVAVMLLEPWDSIQYYNMNPGRKTTLNIKFNDDYYALDMFKEFGTADLLESNPRLYYIMDFDGNIIQANDTRYKIAFKNKNNETGVL